jgi:protein gp37
VRVHRGRGLELWGKGAARHITGEDNWRKPVLWNRTAEEAGVRRRVFTQSLSDTFEDRRDLDAPRARLFGLIESTHWLDWLVLTKRPENMVRLAPASWSKAWPSNAWAGCTVENQEQANQRIPQLLQVRASVRFLSMEPLLGPVDLGRWMPPGFCRWVCSGCRALFAGPLQTRCPSCKREGYWCGSHEGNSKPNGQPLSWIIIGGESGTKARPFELAWARSLVDQAAAAGIAAFVKQLGAFPVDGTYAPREERPLIQVTRTIVLGDAHGGNMAEWPADLQVREFPARAVTL